MKKKIVLALLAAVMTVSPLGTMGSMAAEQTMSQESRTILSEGTYEVPGTNAVLK